MFIRTDVVVINSALVKTIKEKKRTREHTRTNNTRTHETSAPDKFEEQSTRTRETLTR